MCDIKILLATFSVSCIYYIIILKILVRLCSQFVVYFTSINILFQLSLNFFILLIFSLEKSAVHFNQEICPFVSFSLNSFLFF